jgi:hypothetical protein
LLAQIALLSDAVACRGYRFWSTGDDLSKLKPGEVVVRASLVASYKSEKRFEDSIMGVQYGMTYHIKLNDVIKDTGDTGLKAGSEILVRLPPSICEVYEPRNFSENSEKTLVLKKMPDGIIDLVGGKE